MRRENMTDRRYADGLAVRNAVLGEAYVTRVLAEADEFSAPLQQFVTENAWGTVSTRAGRARRERSLVTVAMLLALTRSHELRPHLQGALNSGLTREELREVLLQSAVYCGMPATVDAFRTARALFAGLDGGA
jgi:4-carboxymuconolactone decarboxylase